MAGKKRPAGCAVSRVLFHRDGRRAARGGEGHLSGPALTDELFPIDRESGLPATIGLNHARKSLLGLAPGGVCPAGRLTAAAVRSYHTFSPLPR